VLLARRVGLDQEGAVIEKRYYDGSLADCKAAAALRLRRDRRDDARGARRLEVDSQANLGGDQAAVRVNGMEEDAGRRI